MEINESRTDRVRIHNEVKEIYEQIHKGTDPEQKPFYYLKDIFVVAAILGYHKGIRKEFPNSKIASTIRSEVFSEKEKDILKALALSETEDISILEKMPEEVISGNVLTIAEEYAHGGINELKTAILDKPGYALWNLVDLIHA